MEYTEYRELDAAYCAIIDLYEKCKATHNMPFEIEDRFYIELGELAKKRLVARAEMLDSNPKEADGPQRPPYRLSLTNTIVWLVIGLGAMWMLTYGVKKIADALFPRPPIAQLPSLPVLYRLGHDPDVPHWQTDSNGISRPVFVPLGIIHEPTFIDDCPAMHGGGDLGLIGEGTLGKPVTSIKCIGDSVGNDTLEVALWNNTTWHDGLNKWEVIGYHPSISLPGGSYSLQYDPSDKSPSIIIPVSASQKFTISGLPPGKYTATILSNRTEWNGQITLDNDTSLNFRIYPFLIDHSKIPDHK